MNPTEPFRWPIGLAVIVILGVPLALYSLAPTGPIREGDTVFSDGQQRVRLVNPAAGPSLQPDDTCLLDPGNPLIVILAPNDRPDGLVVAQVQGRQTVEWPFCPLHAEVRLKVHQMSQKPAIFRGVKETVAGLSGR